MASRFGNAIPVDQSASKFGSASLSQAEEDKPGFLMDNLEIPLGIAGSVGGFVLGGPAGAIAGGAAGSGAGSLIEDVIEDKELQFDEALKEAGYSVTIDVATMGLGKVLRPILSPLGLTIKDALSSFRPKKVVAPSTVPPNVGTTESLRETQQLLEAGGEGGSLSATQTGFAGQIRKLGEDIGDIGIFSRARTEARVETNAKILRGEIQRQIDGFNPSLTASQAAVGDNIIQVINSGRKAMSDTYSTGLDSLLTKYGTRRMCVGRLLNNIDSFIKSNEKEFGSTLSSGTIRTIKEIRELANVPGGSISVDSMLALDKKVNTIISEVGDFNSAKFSSIEARELAGFSSSFRNSIEDSLRGSSIDLADGYKALKTQFGESVSALLPDLTANTIGRAKKGDYDSLGRLLLNSSNTSQVKSMMSSIDVAFRELKRAGTDLSALPVKSAAEAKQLIRQSYLKNIFGEVSGSDDITRFRNLARQLEVPKEIGRVRAILGEDFSSYKRLLNAISDTSARGRGGFLSLAFRARETTAALRLATLGAGATAGFTGSLGIAALVFTLPEVLSRIATNRGAVRRLLSLDQAVKKNPNMKPELIAAWMAKIVEALTEEERAAIGESVLTDIAPNPNRKQNNG